MPLFTDKPLYGYRCNSCDHVWDAYRKPAGNPAEVQAVLRQISEERCPECKAGPPCVLNPERYAERKRQRMGRTAA